MKRIKDAKAQRIELLKKYYPVDTKTKTVTFKLYYDHASELLDYTTGETGKEMFKDEFIDKISSILDKIPVDYKADIILEVKDYDTYTEEVIMEKFDDLIAMNSFDALRISKRNCIAASSLIIIGCIILVINAILNTYSFLGNDTILANVLNEALDITSWVFIWQAVTVLFLSPSPESQYIINIFYKLKSFSIATNGVIKVKEDNEKLAKKCQIDSSFSRIHKQTLSITSTLLIFESLVMFIENIIHLATNYSSVDIQGTILEIVIAVLIFVDGLLALSRFTNQFIGNKKFIAIFGVTAAVLIYYFIYNFILAGNWTAAINQIFVIVLLIITFVLCFFWGTLGFKKPKEEK